MQPGYPALSDAVVQEPRRRAPSTRTPRELLHDSVRQDGRVTLAFIRHGQTEMNKVGRFQGRLDSPLTELGEAQARRVGVRLRALAAEVGGDWVVDASPLGRTRRTAELVAEGMGLAVRRHDPRLAEVDFGPWEGLTRDEIVALRPDLAEAKAFFLRCPDGEIGSRKGLKIPRPQGHPGSSPGPGTKAGSEIVRWRPVDVGERR